GAVEPTHPRRPRPVRPGIGTRPGTTGRLTGLGPRDPPQAAGPARRGPWGRTARVGRRPAARSHGDHDPMRLIPSISLEVLMLRACLPRRTRPRPSPPGPPRPPPAKPVRNGVLAVQAREGRPLPSFAAPAALDLGAAPNAVAVGRFESDLAVTSALTANARAS